MPPFSNPVSRTRSFIEEPKYPFVLKTAADRSTILRRVISPFLMIPRPPVSPRYNPPHPVSHVYKPNGRFYITRMSGCRLGGWRRGLVGNPADRTVFWYSPPV